MSGACVLLVTATAVASFSTTSTVFSRSRTPLRTSLLRRRLLPEYVPIPADNSSTAAKQSHFRDRLHRPGSSARLQWQHSPRNALLIKKPGDARAQHALIKVAKWLHFERGINVIVEPSVFQQCADDLSFAHVVSEDDGVAEYSRITDFIVTFGGDGTILHISSLFEKDHPPVVSFSMGTVGFLLPLNIDNYKPALDTLLNGGVDVLQRMRLEGNLHNGETGEIRNRFLVLNDALVHRGHFPHLASVNCFVDGEFLTTGVADGVLVSTPTGSTAYSLSAGGPILHPSVEAITLTPVCPRSLSFRPIVLPLDCRIRIQSSADARGTVEVSADGREGVMMNKTDYLEVAVSPHTVPCMSRMQHGIDWVTDLNNLLKFNQRFGAQRYD
ncbi:ATP-NAD kinase [Ramicandelaber brevisporus]|nr:ATP-NAD kinase [Ramicandelaber brevisporus]